MDHQPLRWPSRAISMSTLRTPGSSTLYMSSIAIRYADLVGALPVSMRDQVEGARLSSSATSSSLSECPSRRRRSSAPSLRLRTVGPRGIGNAPPPDPPHLRWKVNRALHIACNNQYDTAPSASLKSHLGFHLRN